MRYHERTKHHFARFAPGPGQLDWANQPDPFRCFEGAPITRLPLLAPETPLEVETYSWNVLPPAARVGSVAESIIRELRWVQANR